VQRQRGLQVGQHERARLGQGGRAGQHGRIEFAVEAGIGQVGRQQLHGEAAVFDLAVGLFQFGLGAAVLDEHGRHAGHDQQADGDGDHQLGQGEAALGARAAAGALQVHLGSL
jgi:hypothetical protein